MHTKYRPKYLCLLKFSVCGNSPTSITELNPYFASQSSLKIFGCAMSIHATHYRMGLSARLGSTAVPVKYRQYIYLLTVQYHTSPWDSFLFPAEKNNTFQPQRKENIFLVNKTCEVREDIKEHKYNDNSATAQWKCTFKTFLPVLFLARKPFFFCMFVCLCELYIWFCKNNLNWTEDKSCPISEECLNCLWENV